MSRSAPAYHSAVVTAANQWNRTAAPGVFQMATGGANILVTGLRSAEGYWAVTSGTCRPGTKYWAVTVRIRYNTRTMDLLNVRQKWIVMVHELGHTYGLGHVNMTCGAGASVMMQGTLKFGCAGNPPWTDDVYGVERIYTPGVA